MLGCNLFIDCNNKELTWEQLVKMLAQIDANGCPALNTIAAPIPMLMEGDGDILMEGSGDILME